MRNLRDRIRQLGATFVSIIIKIIQLNLMIYICVNPQVMSKNLIGGPEIEDINAIVERTGYKLEVG